MEEKDIYEKYYEENELIKLVDNKCPTNNEHKVTAKSLREIFKSIIETFWTPKVVTLEAEVFHINDGQTKSYCTNTGTFYLTFSDEAHKNSAYENIAKYISNKNKVYLIQKGQEKKFNNLENKDLSFYFKSVTKQEGNSLYVETSFDKTYISLSTTTDELGLLVDKNNTDILKYKKDTNGNLLLGLQLKDQTVCCFDFKLHSMFVGANINLYFIDRDVIKDGQEIKLLSGTSNIGLLYNGDIENTISCWQHQESWRLGYVVYDCVYWKNAWRTDDY